MLFDELVRLPQAVSWTNRLAGRVESAQSTGIRACARVRGGRGGGRGSPVSSARAGETFDDAGGEMACSGALRLFDRLKSESGAGLAGGAAAAAGLTGAGGEAARAVMQVARPETSSLRSAASDGE
jgi:hypothetical protein